MRLRKIVIRNFRGIRELDWVPSNDFSMLIGPCDATKSTILDAIELALLPRWQTTIDDSDFYGCDVAKDIIIELVIGDVPIQLKDETKFGLDLKGWDASREEIIELDASSEEVLVLRFTVDESLEPRWLVISERNTEGRPIPYRDREVFSLTRLGGGTDRQFTWGRGSLLSKMTSDAPHAKALNQAARSARQSFLQADGGSTLNESIAKVSALAQRAGLKIEDGSPGLDPGAVNLNSGAIALHQRGIPFRRAGLGSRILFSVALQRELSDQGAITIVDEVECGLEPFRLRNVLRMLAKGRNGSLVSTSHSPIALQELDAKHINIVRSIDGLTTVTPVPEELQPTVKKAAEAFLSRKVLVCEGMTEVGFLRKIDESRWNEKDKGLAYSGVSLTDGRGSNSAEIAEHFSDLGYDVALFGDSDADTEIPDRALKSKGVTIARWEGGMSIEKRVISDINWTGILEIIDFALEEHPKEHVYTRIAEFFGVSLSELGQVPDQWARTYTEAKAREAIALASMDQVSKSPKKSKQGWFKTAEYGYRLAEIMLRNTAPDKSLEKTLSIVGDWIEKT